MIKYRNRLIIIALVLLTICLTAAGRKAPVDNDYEESESKPLVSPKPSVSPSPLVSPSPTASVSPTPAGSPVPVVKIRIIETEYFTSTEKRTAKKAEEKIAKTIASDCFRDVVLKAKMTERNGKTNAQILDLVRGLSTKVRLTMYERWWSRVVGYVNGDGYIHTNRKFYAGAASCDVGSNIVHELAHDPLGFSHDGSWDSSVPYSINRFFERCCR